MIIGMMAGAVLSWEKRAVDEVQLEGGSLGAGDRSADLRLTRRGAVEQSWHLSIRAKDAPSVSQ
jgi:hypothetical protein